MIHTHGCLEPQSCPHCQQSLQPIGTHLPKLINAFQAPQGEKNWEGASPNSCRRTHSPPRDSTEDASWDNPTWQLPKHQIMTPLPPHTPSSLPHTFTGSHITCLVTSVWVKMCLMKPNLERNPQCQGRTAASFISADR